MCFCVWRWATTWLNWHIWHGHFVWRYRHTSEQHVSVSVLLDTTRATPLRDNKTITTHEHINPQIFFFSSSKLAMSILHSWKLERWSTSSLEHPINKHPVFSKTSKIEFSRASAIFSRGEYFEVPPGDEAGVSHADVHWTLRGVPADGHRPFLHQILEFSALQPGYSRPRHPAYHRHLLRYPVEVLKMCVKRKPISGCRELKRGYFLVLWKRGDPILHRGEFG